MSKMDILYTILVGLLVGIIAWPQMPGTDSEGSSGDGTASAFAPQLKKIFE